MKRLRAKFEAKAKRLLASANVHRCAYAVLAGCHGIGCFAGDKLEIYGPAALVYAVLALK